jgi:hypothetical protein
MKLFLATRIVCAAIFFLLLAGAGTRTVAGDLKLEAQLVIGSNDSKPQVSGLKPVASDIEKKLKKLPLKWDHYYVVSEKKFSVGNGDTKKTSLSTQCQISVRNLGDQRVELTLASNGQNVGKITQSLHKGQTLVAGGDADNSIVVLRQGN